MAQALPILASPILTRIFTPQQFGILALFTAVVGIPTIFATGRYEVAILLPAEDREAFDVVLLAMALTAMVSAAITAVVVIQARPIASLLGARDLSSWLYLVPLMVFLTGTYQALNYWFNRRKQYRRLAVNRAARSFLIVVSSLIMGWIGYRSQGLIVGALTGQALATLSFLWMWRHETQRLGFRYSLQRLLAVARRYKDFAIYSVPGDTINAVSGQMPTLILGMFFGSAITGYYSLTQRVLAGPSSIVSTAIGDVFRQRASEDMVTCGNCRATWIATFKTLIALSVPPYIIVALFAPGLFAFIFGENWRLAGPYAQVLTPFFTLSFTASILSRTMYIAQKQKQDMLWQLVLFAVISSSLLWGASRNSPLLSLALYSVSYSCMYLAYLWMCFRYSQGESVLPHSLTQGGANGNQAR